MGFEGKDFLTSGEQNVFKHTFMQHYSAPLYCYYVIHFTFLIELWLLNMCLVIYASRHTLNILKRIKQSYISYPYDAGFTIHCVLILEWVFPVVSSRNQCL